MMYVCVRENIVTEAKTDKITFKTAQTLRESLIE